MVIYKDGKLALDEPSAVALLPKDDGRAQFIEVGSRAVSTMWENPRIKVVYPLDYGKAPHYEGAEEFLLTKLIKKTGIKHAFFYRFMDTHPRILFATPSVIPQGLNDALKSVVKKLGYEAYVMHKPLAAAIEIGRDFYEDGGMLVDIGASGSVISVVANECIVQDYPSRIGGNRFSQLLIPFVAEEHGTRIGFSTATRVKIEIGSASQDGTNEGYRLIGPDVTTGKPKRIMLTSYEIASYLNESLLELENEIRSVLNFTPPELIAKIVRSGIHLIGGSAQLRNLDKRLSENLGISCRVVDNPRHIVAQGAYKAMMEESGLLLTL
jgi:rod shape-determining protein MreB